MQLSKSNENNIKFHSQKMICVYVDAEKVFAKWCGPYKITEMTNSEFETMKTIEQQSIDNWIDICGDTIYGIYREFVWYGVAVCIHSRMYSVHCLRF